MQEMIKQYALPPETLAAAQDVQAGVSCFGWITDIQPDSHLVRVDFEGNPFGTSVSARLGREFRSTELQLAVDNRLSCRIEFVNSDISLPVLTDIFFPIVEQDELRLSARKITLEAEQEVVAYSGAAFVKLDGRSGHVVTEGKHVASQARQVQKITGATVSIN